MPLGHGDVGAVLPRAFQEAEADRIEADDIQRAVRMTNLADRFDFFETAEEIGMLHDDAQRLSSTAFLRVSGSR